MWSLSGRVEFEDWNKIILASKEYKLDLLTKGGWNSKTRFSNSFLTFFKIIFTINFNWNRVVTRETTSLMSDGHRTIEIYLQLPIRLDASLFLLLAGVNNSTRQKKMTHTNSLRLNSFSIRTMMRLCSIQNSTCMSIRTPSCRLT